MEHVYVDLGDPPIHKIESIKRITVENEKEKIYHNEVSLFLLQIGIKTK